MYSVFNHIVFKYSQNKDKIRMSDISNMCVSSVNTHSKQFQGEETTGSLTIALLIYLVVILWK